MDENSIKVILIRDRREVCHEGRTLQLLAFDLKDVLDAIGQEVDALTWRVHDLDCWNGQETAFRRLQEVAAHDLRIDGHELRAIARNIAQVNDGTFVGFEKGTPQDSIRPQDLDTRTFPDSRAKLIICAFDSSWFEVFAKDVSVEQQLRRRFADVSLGDPKDYFTLSAGGAR